MNIINQYIGLNVQFILLYIVLDVLSFTRRDNNGLFWQLLFSHWCGTNQKKFYYIYRPLQFAFESTGEDTFWLEHFYQIGHYTWKSFSLKQFLWFSITASLFLVISNLI